MSLSASMDTKEVQSLMTEMQSIFPKEDRCTTPVFDHKYMFTIGPTDTKKTAEGYDPPSYPVGDYGSCSAFTGYKTGILHIGTAVRRPAGQSWASVPGEPSFVETFYPITNQSFRKTGGIGEYELKTGPLVLKLKGPAYDILDHKSIRDFAMAKYRDGEMSIVDFEVSEGQPDPRFRMTEQSLDGTLMAEVTSCHIERPRSASRREQEA